MKRIILSKLENEFLIHCLEELIKNIPETELVDQKWLDKIEPTRRQFNLELSYFKIKNNSEQPTKKEFVQWLLIKLKNKTADLS